MTGKTLREKIRQKEMKLTTLHQVMAYRQRQLFLNWKELIKYKKDIKLLLEKLSEIRNYKG